MNSSIQQTSPDCADNLKGIVNALRPGDSAYLVGVGGCGMSGLGHLLLDIGCQLHGSDMEESQYIDALRKRGADIGLGHSLDIIERCKPQLVIRSSAIRWDNPELQWALERNVPVAGRGAVLSEISNRFSGICVAGMHGKTTTTALMAFVLAHMGVRCGYAVGAQVRQLQPHARMPGISREFANSDVDKSAYFVVEADESDGSLCSFKPAHAILLNVDREHLDHFSCMAAVLDEFQKFAFQTAGYVVYCADDAQLESLFGGDPRWVSYGFSASADFQIKPCTPVDALAVEMQHFQIFRKDRNLGAYSLALPGDHNAMNAAAVIALLTLLGFESGKIAAAMRDFRGVSRRQQLLYNDGDWQVYDDYGHHPQEISATLRALKPAHGGRLLTVFQPHRFTRTKFLWPEFSVAFGGADHVWLTDIYPASEKPIEGVNGLRFSEAVRSNHPSASYAPQEALLVEMMQKEMKHGDRVLFLGAGSITKVAHRFARRLLAERNVSQQLLYEKLCQAAGPSGLARRDEPMAKHTTWRVGGKADFYVEPESEASLAAILRICHEFKKPFFILGRGSNLLVRDGGYRGIVISLSQTAFGYIRVDGERIQCGAGARLRDVVMEARRHQLAGLEFLEGIPGSVGGGLRMNAGAMQHSLFDVVEQARIMNYKGIVEDLPSSQIPVVYRSCPLLRNRIALGAVLKGGASTSSEIEARLVECNQKRWKSQPAAPSAGCVFQNPPAASAGRIIDELGLKGWRVGGAVVSDKHANFFVNDGGATARDIALLIDWVRLEVYRARQIWLQTEIQIIGEDEEPGEFLMEGE